MLMLKHLGETDAAERVLAAVRAVIGEGEFVTYDIKRSRFGTTEGAVGTQAYADALIERL
jgi:isocitrate dehydrogenase (NAD+)